MSPVNRRAVEAITELNAESEPIGGRLGIPIDGIRQVNVANRPGFVYVRLRDNPNELVQAFNESVSAVYDLPVLVEFKNNRYTVIGRDTDRYSSWGSDSSYLPTHASQHSMLANQLGGGDPVFVDGRQMMPGAAYPSGTLGGPNVLISDFLFRNKIGNWLYIGNTGTPDLNTLRPNGSTARMVLVCLDYTSGGFVILTGSTFSATLTGTSQIWPFVPNNNLDQVPLAAIRIVSGTTSIGWDNIYDARQWIDSGFPTGSSGGGGTPGGNSTNVQFNNAGTFGGVDAFVWNGSTGLYIGAPGALPVSDSLLDLVADGSSPKLQFWAYGATQFASIFGYRARGTLASPSALAQNDEIIKLSAAGFYGGGWTDEQGSFQFVADEAWTVTGVGTKAEMRITPRGSTTLTLVQDWQGDFVNIYKPLNMATNYIHNVVDPVLDKDAATKSYVDDRTSMLYGESILGSIVTLTGTNGTYQDTLLSVTLPEAGTYRLSALVRGSINGNAGTVWWLTSRLFNSTDAAAVSNSEVLIVLTVVSGQGFQMTAPMEAIVTVSASKVIKLHVSRNASVGGSWTTSNVESNTAGRTSLRYIKILE